MCFSFEMEFIRPCIQYLCSGDNYHFFTFTDNVTCSPSNDNIPSLRLLCSNYLVENIEKFSLQDIEKIPLELVQEIFHRLEKKNDQSHFYFFRNSGIESGYSFELIHCKS